MHFFFCSNNTPHILSNCPTFGFDTLFSYSFCLKQTTFNPIFINILLTLCFNNLFFQGEQNYEGGGDMNIIFLECFEANNNISNFTSIRYPCKINSLFTEFLFVSFLFLTFHARHFNLRIMILYFRVRSTSCLRRLCTRAPRCAFCFLIVVVVVPFLVLSCCANSEKTWVW